VTKSPAKHVHTGTLDDYKEEYLRCRGLRNHTWKFETDFNVATGPRGKIIEFTRTLSCMSCTTQRLDTYTVKSNGRFEFQRRAYQYAEGYQVHRGNPIATEEARDALLVKELSSSLDKELLNRLLGMRPEKRSRNPLRVIKAS
jgi:hypothetical protein